MDDPETSSQAALVGTPTGQQDAEGQSWREWAAIKLQARRFHNAVFALIVFDCIIVIIELCFTLLTECTPPSFIFEGSIGGVDPNKPHWLQILLYISMGISCVFLLELPIHAWAFGLQYYSPWSDVQHSIFHLADALIIVMNFTILFLQGPAQELVGLLVILRLWRLIKLLGGVAEGVGGLNNELLHRLECAEKELASKNQQLEDANRKLDDLQGKLDAMQP